MAGTEASGRAGQAGLPLPLEAGWRTRVCSFILHALRVCALGTRGSDAYGCARVFAPGAYESPPPALQEAIKQKALDVVDALVTTCTSPKNRRGYCNIEVARMAKVFRRIC